MSDSVHNSTLRRREFFATCAVLLVAPRALAASRGPVLMPECHHHDAAVALLAHPIPRAGITGAKVLTAAQLGERTELVPLFDGIRAIPQIADGIRCNCGCATLPGYYSLLSCYEGDAMAKICPICQGQGRLAVRLQKEGKSLADIRVAIDAQFG